jgi:hypothetical protein
MLDLEIIIFLCFLDLGTRSLFPSVGLSKPLPNRQTNPRVRETTLAAAVVAPLVETLATGAAGVVGPVTQTRPGILAPSLTSLGLKPIDWSKMKLEQWIKPAAAAALSLPLAMLAWLVGRGQRPCMTCCLPPVRDSASVKDDFRFGASIEMIDKVAVVTGEPLLEWATVSGRDVLVPAGEFRPGDAAIFIPFNSGRCPAHQYDGKQSQGILVHKQNAQWAEDRNCVHIDQVSEAQPTEVCRVRMVPVFQGSVSTASPPTRYVVLDSAMMQYCFHPDMDISGGIVCGNSKSSDNSSV